MGNAGAIKREKLLEAKSSILGSWFLESDDRLYNVDSSYFDPSVTLPDENCIMIDYDVGRAIYELHILGEYHEAERAEDLTREVLKLLEHLEEDLKYEYDDKVESIVELRREITRQK